MYIQIHSAESYQHSKYCHRYPPYVLHKIQCKNIVIDSNTAKVYKDGKELLLTSLEYRILLMLFNNKGILIKREQLLEKIWDIAGSFVNDNTLTVYIKRIREKLDDKNGEIIQTVRGIGYMVVEK